MRVERVELRIVALPMVAPFAAAHGTVSIRRSVLVRLVGADGEGWGECAALEAPTYTSEFVAAAFLALRDHLVPRLLDAGGHGPGPTAADLGRLTADVVGQPMAKAALELALLDYEGRAAGVPLARLLVPDPPGPARSVVAGAAVGLLPDPEAVAAEVAALCAAGYGRVKVKIAPGRDLDHVRAAREAADDGVVLMVDANGAYRLDAEPGAPEDARRLEALDALALACIEQPLPADDLLDHVELARRLDTPVCLDESLTSPALTFQALDMGACSVVCVKAPRYGSWRAAAEVLERCAGTGTPAWVGGMLDGGLGRRANVALASHPGASLPGDLAATDRYFTDDVCPSVTLDRTAAPATVAVPDEPGLGVEVDSGVVDRLTERHEQISR